MAHAEVHAASGSARVAARGASGLAHTIGRAVAALGSRAALGAGSLSMPALVVAGMRATSLATPGVLAPGPTGRAVRLRREGDAYRVTLDVPASGDLRLIWSGRVLFVRTVGAMGVWCRVVVFPPDAQPGSTRWRLGHDALEILVSRRA